MKQIFKRKLSIAGAAVFMLSASLGLFSAPAFAAGNTCTWIGSATGSWNTSSNWSGCGGGVPQNGDSLVFDSTGLTSINVHNDISNLQLNNITFQGTSIYPFDIYGNAISLSGGITDNTQFGAGLSMDVTLTASQTFSSKALLYITGSNLYMGNYNLDAVATSSGRVDFYSAITGTGNLTLSNDGNMNFINNNNPNFSGPIHITQGTLVINAAQTNPLGSGHVTIDNGATLQESINSNGTYTISNPITMAGNGAGFWSAGALVVYGYSATGTVNFTGPITLTGDATVGVTSASVNISGAVSGCGLNISLASGTTGTLSGNLDGSCTSTTTGSTTATTSGPSTTTGSVSAPDTGSGAPSSRAPAYIALLAAVISLASGLRCLALGDRKAS